MNAPLFDYGNPYPYYRYLREYKPVYCDKEGTYFISRYDDVKLVISDQRFMRRPSIENGFVSNAPIEPHVVNILDKWLILNDPPRHTKLRTLLASLLDTRAIKNMRFEIKKIAYKYINQLLLHNEFDFMKEFSYPYAVSVISQLFGVDFDIDMTRKWSRNISMALDHGTKEDFESITPDLEMLIDYFSKIISGKKHNNDWIEKLISFEKLGELSHDDVISTCIFLALAGHETVQLTLGLGVMSLLKNPLQLNLLQNNPDLLPSAIEEMLRYESAISRISRWTREATQLGGITIPKNQLVVGIINSANRDETKFPSPDTFDITRKMNKHISLGYGIHHCLGALLARIELNIAFSILLPHLHHFNFLDNGIEWLHNKSVRYLNKLSIKLTN